jgi:hypothetical protein
VNYGKGPVVKKKFSKKRVKTRLYLVRTRSHGSSVGFATSIAFLMISDDIFLGLYFDKYDAMIVWLYTSGGLLHLTYSWCYFLKHDDDRSWRTV